MVEPVAARFDWTVTQVKRQMDKSGLLKDWQSNGVVTEQALREAVASLGRPLPADYVRFLREHNGGEGFVGERYLVLWKAEELRQFNSEYEVEQYAPGLLLFGSSGGGEAYAFDTRTAEMPIVRVPFIGMDLRYAIPVASTFDDLFVKLAK